MLIDKIKTIPIISYFKTLGGEGFHLWCWNDDRRSPKSSAFHHRVSWVTHGRVHHKGSKIGKHGADGSFPARRILRTFHTLKKLDRPVTRKQKRRSRGRETHLPFNSSRKDAPLLATKIGVDHLASTQVPLLQWQHGESSHLGVSDLKWDLV